MSLSKVTRRVPYALQLAKYSVFGKGNEKHCAYGNNNEVQQLRNACSKRAVHNGKIYHPCADTDAIQPLRKVSKRRVQTGTALSSHSYLTDPENTGKPQIGVNFDTLGTWENRLEMPIMVEKSAEKGKLIPQIPLDEVGKATLIGRRKVNEDRYVIQELSPSLLYFGIYDGHGGSQAVDLVHDTMQHHIAYWLTQSKDLYSVLRNSFQDVNNVLTRHLAWYHTGRVRIAESAQSTTGTTATVCLLRNGIELVVGHVGDTRAVLCREGRAIRLTEDHHPDLDGEWDRILEHGGRIIENSLGVPVVNGRLAMTRSIGDIQLKQYGVTAEPFERSIEVMHGKDAFLVLLTDGLSFVLSDQEICDLVCGCANPTEAARVITDTALQFGSEDNSSAVVVPFGAWGKYMNKAHGIPFSFGRSLSSRTRSM